MAFRDVSKIYRSGEVEIRAVDDKMCIRDSGGVVGGLIVHAGLDLPAGENGDGALNFLRHVLVAVLPGDAAVLRGGGHKAQLRLPGGVGDGGELGLRQGLGLRQDVYKRQVIFPPETGAPSL